MRKPKEKTNQQNEEFASKTKESKVDPRNGNQTEMVVTKSNYSVLDKNLSPELEREWNSIYASFRSKSLLTGTVIGTDTTKLEVLNLETKKYEEKEVLSLVIIDYRVKVLIPKSEIWNEDDTYPDYVLRSMVGATVDYIITNYDRLGECALASRRLALKFRQKQFKRRKMETGEQVNSRILAVGKRKCLVEAGGFETILVQKDIRYSMIEDLRELFHPGNEKPAIFKGFDPETGRIQLSIKEVDPHPFDGAINRHPIGSRRMAVISGKYKGGVFCKIDNNIDCMCLYSADHYDIDFNIGDKVIVVLTHYNTENKLIYGKIISKW